MAANQSNMGSWEKHTKGIGMKLLNKFGFKGRLGAKEDGVSASIEVKVRPNGLGLGFGDFKEAPALRSNKILEAEWRKDPNIVVDEEDESKPLVESIAASKSWKKGHKSRAKDIEVDESDLQQEEIMEIVDMRGPTTKTISSSNRRGLSTQYSESDLSSFDFGIGKELLYNISMITDLSTQEYTKTRNLMKSADSSLQTAYDELEGVEIDLKRHTERLETLLEIKLSIDDIEQCVESSTDDLEIYSLIKRKLALFPKERSTFGLHYIIFNSLCPFVVAQFERWEPLISKCPKFKWWDDLKNNHEEVDPAIINEVDSLFRYKCEDISIGKVMRVVSVKWNVRDPDSLIEMFEELKHVYTEAKIVFLLGDFVLPRLKEAVSNWDPARDEIPIHSWLHPWLPLLQDKLACLYPDIRRKLTRTLSDWKVSDHSASKIIRPWHGVFDRDSMNSFLGRSIIPKLLEYSKRIEVFEAGGIDSLKNVLIWVDIIPKNHLLAIFVGEFLPRWQNVLLEILKGQDHTSAAKFYIALRRIIPLRLLGDQVILESFDRTIEMMGKFCSDSSQDGIKIPSNSYQEILRRLDTEKKSMLNYNSMKKSVKLENSLFKNVVEAFAESHGITFLPKQGRFVDGKQIWAFGSENVYIEHDVVFVSPSHADTPANSSASWKPVTLDELLLLALDHGK